MKTVSLIQGSPAWCAHRAQDWNASDAPGNAGVSPDKVAQAISARIQDRHQSGIRRGHATPV